MRKKCRTSFTSCDKWIILHTNIRGYESKAYSLHTILNEVIPSVVTINETFLKNNRKLRIPGFMCYNRNRQCNNGGGIATCVTSKDAMHALKVFEGGNDNETLITRHSQFSIPLNIINIYGEQESRTSNEKIQEKWTNILHETSKIEAKSEHVLLIGDLNKHVGSLVEGNEKDKM